MHEQYERRKDALAKAKADLENPKVIKELGHQDVAQYASYFALMAALLGRHQEARDAFREAVAHWQQCLYYERHEPNEIYVDEEHEWLTAAVLTGDLPLARELALATKGERVNHKPHEGHYALALKHLLLGDDAAARSDVAKLMEMADQAKLATYAALGRALLAILDRDELALQRALAELTSVYPRGSGRDRYQVTSWACLEGAAVVQVARWRGMEAPVDHRLLVPAYLESLRKA